MSYNLLQFKKTVYSQFGEDGIIEKILSEIGTKNRWAVDIGAYDGIKHSNIMHLVKNGGCPKSI